MEPAVMHDGGRRTAHHQRILQPGAGQRGDDLAQRRGAVDGDAERLRRRPQPVLILQPGGPSGCRRRAGAARRATRCGPGNGPAACACSAPAAPSRARKVNAVTTVAAASSRSRSTTASAARPMVSALDDISASPSPWSSASGRQGQREPGQRRDVAGAEGVEPADGRHPVVVEQVDQRGRGGRPEAAAADRDLLDAHRRHGPDLLRRQRWTGRCRMTAQQAVAVLERRRAQPCRTRGLADRRRGRAGPSISRAVEQGADTGRPAVHRPVRGEPEHRGVTVDQPLAATAGRERDRLAVPGDGHDLLAGERPGAQFDHQHSVAAAAGAAQRERASARPRRRPVTAHRSSASQRLSGLTVGGTGYCLRRATTGRCRGRSGVNARPPP